LLVKEKLFVQAVFVSQQVVDDAAHKGTAVGAYQAGQEGKE